VVLVKPPERGFGAGRMHLLGGQVAAGLCLLSWGPMLCLSQTVPHWHTIIWTGDAARRFGKRETAGTTWCAVYVVEQQPHASHSRHSARTQLCWGRAGMCTYAATSNMAPRGRASQQLRGEGQVGCGKGAPAWCPCTMHSSSCQPVQWVVLLTLLCCNK